MANVVLDDSSLIAIGEALRGKLGATKMEDIVIQNPLPFVKKTSGATSHDSLGSLVSHSSVTYTVFTIPGATSILLKCGYNINSNTCRLEAKAGNYTEFSSGGGSSLINSLFIGETRYRELTLNSTESVTIATYGKMAYYIEICGLDADGNEMAYYETLEPGEVANTFKPREMADAINKIGGSLKVIPIEGTDISASAGLDYIGYYHEFDLSPYVNEGDNFLLFYTMTRTSNYSAYGNGATGVFSPYNSSSEYTTFVNTSSSRSVTNTGLYSFFGTSANDAVAYVNSYYQSPFIWKDLKFTPGCLSAKNAILVYCG